MGGKARIAKKIIKAITDDTYARDIWVEPFVGGGNVLEHAAPIFHKSIGMDGHVDLIMMWQDVMNGWNPIDVDRDTYNNMRHSSPSGVRGYVGFGASFGGKWFGGYGVSPRDGEVWRASQRSVIRQGEVFRNNNVKFIHCMFGNFNPESGSVVYCDPPYQGTTNYSLGNFDHDKFYKIISQWSLNGCHVYVSGYDIPTWVDHRIIWSGVKRNVLDKCENKRIAVEKLFKILN